MLTCHGCHRHVRTAESACPFCGAAVDMASAPAPIRIGMMVLAVGLAVLGCETEEDTGPSTTTTNGMTTMTTTDGGESGESGETGDTTGDGDGDVTTGVPGEAGSDYGAPPPPRDTDWC